MPLSDVGTDFSTFLSLLSDGQAWWAGLTLGWMFVPVIIRLATFIYLSIRNMCGSDSEGRGISEVKCGVMLSFFKGVIVHLPFCLPLYSLYLANKLRKLRYGKTNFDASNSAKVEAILSEVAKSSFLESYFEAGGQATLQLIIILSTGQASISQQISIVLSLLSLAWGASRGYFHQRSQDAADPDPAFLMVVMRVFPLMLVIVLNSLLLWVFIGGLLGPWTFLALLINSGLIFSSLKVTTALSSKRRRRRRRSAGEGAIRMRRTAMGTQTATRRPEPTAGRGGGDVEEARSELDVREGMASEESDNFFILKASTFSVWLPSVVGNITHFPYVFLISSVASLAAKVVTLAMAVVLAVAGLQDKIQPHHFLLLCIDNASLNNDTNIVYCTAWEECFNNSDNLKQKKPYL